MIRKTLLTLGLTAGLVAAGTGVASAHECYIANRSDKGNAGASHSANWYTLHVSELYSSAHEFLQTDALTEEQLATALAMTEEQDIPLSFTVFERFTIPRNLGEFEDLSAKSTDGKGVDHFFAKYGEDLIGIFFAAQAS